MVSISAAQINAFKREVDSKRNGGNGNSIVDGSEIELFNKKCKTAGLDNIDEIMEDYNENRTQREAEFESKRSNTKTSVETAVIAALTEDTVLRTNEQAENSAQSVKEGVKEADGDCVWYNPFTWFNNQEEILDSTKFITSSNVVDVVSDKNILEKIEDADSDVREQIANQTVLALVEAAKEAKVDVSDIVFVEDDAFKTGRAISAKFGSSVGENFTEVVKALSKKIKDAKDTLNGTGDKAEMLTIASRKIDASSIGNGNGYIDKAEEVVEFKQFAAEHGIDVDAILEQIRDNEENGVENTTKAQKTIYNIFDPEQKAARAAAYAAADADVARALADGVQYDDPELLASATSAIDPDNVMTVLNNNPNLIKDIINNYSHNWFVNWFVDDTYQEYTNPILVALVQHALENGIEISDIVLVDENGNMMTGKNSGVKAGKDATDEDYVQSVIAKLQKRINDEEKV